MHVQSNGKSVLKILMVLYFIFKFGYCSSPTVHVHHGERIKRRISPLKASVLKMKTCDQTEIPAMDNFDIERFSGAWYELGKTVSGYADPDDGMWMFNSNLITEGYNFIYSGRSRNGECIPSISGTAVPSLDNPGELVIKYRMHSNKVSERVRILDTDYDTYAILFACMYLMPDGKCHPAGIMGAIWTRLPHVGVRVFNEAITILNKACIDSASVMIRTKHGQGICPPEDEDLLLTENQNLGSCNKTSECALHCPPCCRERSNGCISCDCENVVIDEFVKCKSSKECPFHCVPREIYPGCYVCKCTDELPKKVKKPICLETKDEGTCSDKEYRYYYNVIEGKCKRFVYFGCGGSKNNFQTLESCVATCEDNSDETQDSPGKFKIVTGTGTIAWKINHFSIFMSLVTFCVAQNHLST